MFGGDRRLTRLRGSQTGWNVVIVPLSLTAIGQPGPCLDTHYFCFTCHEINQISSDVGCRADFDTRYVAVLSQ